MEDNSSYRGICGTVILLQLIPVAAILYCGEHPDFLFHNKAKNSDSTRRKWYQVFCNATWMLIVIVNILLWTTKVVAHHLQHKNIQLQGE